MKKQLNLHKLFVTLALLLTATWSFATGGDDSEKKKTYSKSYPLSASEKISISNMFGEVKIATWDKMEVKVEVTVTVHAASDEKAQSILDGISIEDGKNEEGVFFKTKMPQGDHDRVHKEGDKDDKDKQKDKGDKKNSSGMDVNYVVMMPAASPLKLTNQFGKSIVPDLSGPVDILEKFGDLSAGNLSNAKTVQVEFGSASIESIANCKLVIKFSKASIKKMTGSIKSNFEFCDKITLPLNNSITEFTLNNSYSTIDLSVTNDFSGDFQIHTNFGKFNNKSALVIKEDKEDKDDDDHGPRFDKDFSGKSGSGACKVRMKSSFGNIRLI
ncbi:MAG TPA: hypothetical protein VGM41_05835 [Chitinophagaceae bacterium]|jgi:hypothetical protein